ncbi:MAG: PAS domain S-box protein [Candidatus Heimdallarchaeaceae archaeon]
MLDSNKLNKETVLEKIKVLHIDDDEDFLLLSKQYIENETKEAIIFHVLDDPTKVFEMLEKEEFDVIVCDYLMPELDGLDILLKLKEKKKEVPFIIFTGRSREEIAIKALNLGVKYYIKKDPDTKSQYAELVNHIKRAAEFSRTEEALVESEERFFSFMENIPAIAFIKTIDEELVYVNNYLLRIANHHQTLDSEQYNENLQRLVKSKGKQEREILKNKGILVEELNLKIGNKNRLFQIFKFPLRHKNTELLIGGFGIDVTEKTRALMELKKKQEELLRQRNKMHQYLNVAGVMIVILNADGTTHFINKKVTDILGYTEEDLIGKNLFDVIYPEKIRKELKTRFYQSMKKNRKPSEYLEVELVTKTGEKKVIAFRNIEIRDHEGNLIQIFGTGEDITRRKELENEIKRSEEKYRTVIETSPDSIVLSNLEGEIIFANKEAAKMHGYDDPNDLIGQNIMTFTAPEDYDKAKQEFIGTINVEYASSSIYLVKKDGTKFPVEMKTSLIRDEEGKPTAILAIGRDITERLKSEEGIRKSEVLYRTVFESTGTANIIVGRDNIIKMVNSKAGKLAGYQAKDVVGKKKWTEFIPLKERKMMLEYNKKRFDDPHAVPKQYETKIITGDGKIKNILINLSPVINTTDLIVSVVDITEQKNIEQELLKKKEELSIFAHMIAHDIRNSLSTVEGFLDLLQLNFKETYVDKINKQLKYMRELVDRSIDLAEAGREIHKDKKVDLAKLISKISELTVPQTIQLELDKLPTVLADESKLSQIVKNLLENAVIHGKPKLIEVRCVFKKEKCIISFINDGDKPNQKLVNKALNATFSTKEIANLHGLMIVKKIVEAHNWEIIYNFKMEKTCFDLIVPKEDVQ